jgi:DNA polymerase III delta prime subunit
MNTLDNENNDKIYNHLINLYNINTIPNIILHGNSLSGKKTLLEKFLNTIYKNEVFEKYVLIINCAHGKGNIKFIRENLKSFSNSIINNKDKLFKSVILLIADKLTIDAQSALRRCIEIYNHTTRFFIVIDKKEKLLKPIVSRFSDIYFYNTTHIYNDIIKDKKISLLSKFMFEQKYAIKNTNTNTYTNTDTNTYTNIDTKTDFALTDLIKLSEKLYNNGYSGNILIDFINKKLPNDTNKNIFLLTMEIAKKNMRNEKLLILFCLNHIYFRNNIDLENISSI